MDIATALSVSAKELGWSPTKVAAEVGVREKTAIKWMTGAARPNVDFFQTLRRVVPGFARRVDEQVAA